MNLFAAISLDPFLHEKIKRERSIGTIKLYARE